MLNRFSDEYAEREIDWYDLVFYNKNGIQIKTLALHGRADELFNKRLWFKELQAPIMTIEGKLWMSLTPLEIQSHILPVKRAWGYVGTGGLGMGYFALKCAEKKEVHEIKVWEINEDVIKFFNECFHDRAGFEKISIIHGDVREMKGQQFSFFYNDVYSTQLGDAVLEDTDLFWQNGNDCGEYYFWCQERVIITGFAHYHLDLNLLDDEFVLLAEFMDSHFTVGSQRYMKNQNFSPLMDEEFVTKTLRDYLGRL